MSAPVAKFQDVRALGYCSRGARKWFEVRGWSWQDFLKNGIPVATLRATPDAMGNAVASQAERRLAKLQEARSGRR